MPRVKGTGKGFTLIEVLVAMTIMAIAVVYLVALWSSNLRMISTSGDYMNALIQAESKMRDIVGSNGLEEKSWVETTDDGRQVDVAISEVLKERWENLPVTLLQIELKISWEAALKKKNVTLRTFKVVNKINMEAAGD